MGFRGPLVAADLVRSGDVVLVTVQNRSGSVHQVEVEGVVPSVVITVAGNDTFHGAYITSDAVAVVTMPERVRLCGVPSSGE